MSKRRAGKEDENIEFFNKQGDDDNNENENEDDQGMTALLKSSLKVETPNANTNRPPVNNNKGLADFTFSRAEISNYVFMLKEHLRTVRWSEVPDKLKEYLKSIQWSEIPEKVKETLKSIQWSEIPDRIQNGKRMAYAQWVASTPELKKKIIFSVILFACAVVLPWLFHKHGIRRSQYNAIWDPHDLANCDIRRYNATWPEFTARIRSIDDKNLFCDQITLKASGQPCRCTHPTKPLPITFRQWERAFEVTKQIVKTAEALDALQVVLIGDSIIERWNGLSVGKESTEYREIKVVFQNLFTVKGGGQINGVALGIGGDKGPNLLYRIQNGGIGDLHPKVWWQLIGTNDLASTKCNVNAVVASNIAIVEEILQLRPSSTVVLNSILPRTPHLWDNVEKVNQRLECYAAMTDHVEFFNATDLFLSSEDGSFQHMPDTIHPDSIGYQKWGERIVNKVVELTKR